MQADDVTRAQRVLNMTRFEYEKKQRAAEEAGWRADAAALPLESPLTKHSTLSSRREAHAFQHRCKSLAEDTRDVRAIVQGMLLHKSHVGAQVEA